MNAHEIFSKAEPWILVLAGHSSTLAGYACMEGVCMGVALYEACTAEG